MADTEFSYHPAAAATGAPLPLERYLPPIQPGAAAAWLAEHASPGSWVIDPFGSTPLLALELARAGYRVLIASNNPILSFMTEILAEAHPRADFQAALAHLASSRRGDELLETHLQSLYLTECAVCGRAIPAQGFLWKNGAAQPFARLLRCPHCGDESERPITPNDLDRLEKLPGQASLHRARAFERVNIDPDLRENIEEALRTYQPRQLYFLFTLINKIEGLALPEDRRRLLLALAFSLCDDASTLWPHAGGRSRPRQLTTPPQFVEKNLWLALEAALPLWASQEAPLPFTRWPQTPPASGGICLYTGRLRSLLPLPAEVQPAAAFAVLPRPSQAFWTYSAIWSGWVWGREAVLPLKGSLERRRYDWQWYAGAITATIGALRRVVTDGFPLLALLPDLAPGFLAAALLAAEAADFHLEGMAVRPAEEQAQVFWKAASLSPARTGHPVETVCKEAVRACLLERAEPTPYLPLYAACLSSLARNGALPPHQEQVAREQLTTLQNAIGKAFLQPGLRRYENQSEQAESGLWALADLPTGNQPLSDQIEKEVVRHLQKHPGCTTFALDSAMCRQFSGTLTPDLDLLLAVLESYGQAEGDPLRWYLRANEQPAARRADLDEAARTLQSLARRMGFTVEGDQPQTWRNPDGSPAYTYHFLGSALVSRYVLGEPPAGQGVLVLPGSRARLISQRLRRDPRLAEAARSWHFLKLRHLRNLATRTDLTPSLWLIALDGDPPGGEDAVQLQML